MLMLHGAAAVSGPVFDRHRTGEAIAADMVSRHSHRFPVDVASENLAAQPFRCGDRENAAAGANIERPPKTAALRKPVKRQEATGSRLMLASAERTRRVDLDRHGARWRLGSMMGAMDEKASDPKWWKGTLVLGE